MEKIAATTFKKEFGRVMEDAHSHPITITRHGQDFVTMLPSSVFEEIKSNLLGEYFLEKVDSGAMGFIEALREERRILSR